MSGQKLRVAIIGAGGWGYQHARAFSARDDVELLCVVGRTEARTVARADEFGIRYYLDVGEMLQEEKPDFVSICLPGRENIGPVMQVIEANIPLLIEKPIAYDLGEARAMIDAARKRNLFFAINFNHSCSPAVEQAEHIMEGGRIGRMLYARWHFTQGANGFRVTHPHLETIEAQCHGFDLVEHLCGPIESISADMTDIGGNDGYNTIALSLRFASGAVGTFLASFDASDNYEANQVLDICGTDGRVFIEDNTKRCSFQRADSNVAEIWRPGVFDDERRSFGKNLDRHLERMLTALKNGGKPPIPAERGLRALELGLAAIESFETGRRVRVQP